MSMRDRRLHVSRGFLPGMFTMGNVACGFLAILSAFDGRITQACWFVILAGFLDALDGKVARLSGSTSQFGVELDSLADFLSFGVAPAVIVYVIKLQELGDWRFIISLVYILAAAYRLARYNLLADSDEKKDFLGLPVPAAAFGLVSYVIFCYSIWGQLEYSEVLITMIVLLAFLMVSQVQYEAVPDRFLDPSGPHQTGRAAGRRTGPAYQAETCVVSLDGVVYIAGHGDGTSPVIQYRGWQSHRAGLSPRERK